MSKVSRRAFLGAAAAAAGTAAVPTAAAAEQIASLAGVAPLQPIAAAPAYPFRWWVSFDGGEVFSDDFATREEAVAYAEGSGGGMNAECQQGDFDLDLRADDIYEALRENNEEAIGEGDFIDWPLEQGQELEREVNAVIAAWAERHKINRTAWLFAATRNHEEIEPHREQQPLGAAPETKASANG